MINLVENVKGSITQLISNSIQKAIDSNEFPKFDMIDIELECPRDKQHGDFATNTAMKLTKIVKNPPRKIAQTIVDNMNLENTIVEEIEIAGPGFINFKLNRSWLYEVIPVIFNEKSNYGKVNIGKKEKVMVEFISANPTGPMHMGNARGGAIGDSLANILSWAGYIVTKEFYVNDAGNQIEKFGNSLEARYIQILKGEDSIIFPEDGYKGEDIVKRAEEFIHIHGDKYLETESKERKEALIKYALEKNIDNIKEDLKKYGIEYDVWFRESSLYKDNEVQETIEYLKESGYSYENEEALWFKSSQFGAEKDDVLVRNNGIPTYYTADIAYHRNKFIKRNYDKVINIWGADHHGHVARMKGAMEAIGCDPQKLEIIIMQLVRLMRNGQVARMSKRTGKAITLIDLIDEIGRDAARFFFNLRQAGSHMDFDLDLAVSQSDENPVYYVQYAHARICSIIKLLEQEKITVDTNNLKLEKLQQEIEIDILRKLVYWPEEIKNSAQSLEPSKITRYVMDLASALHSFYNNCRVKNDDEELMNARLALIVGVKTVIKNALNVLGVSAPEKM